MWADYSQELVNSLVGSNDSGKGFKFIPILGQLLIVFDFTEGFIKGFTSEDGGFLKGIRQAFAKVIEGLSFVDWYPKRLWRLL